MRNLDLVSLLSVTILILPRISQCQLGKTFYLAPMPLYMYSVKDDPCILKIVSEGAGSVNVIAPGLGINMTHPLVPGITDVSLGNLLASADGVDNKGIQIITSVDVRIYVIEGLNWGGYGKIMSLMPIISSATSFVVQSYLTDWDIRKSHFLVVATEDFTDVNITLKTATTGNITYKGVDYEDGNTIRISLSRLQTFYAYLYANDVSGSVIQSNKPIVVLSGADCVDIPKHVAGGCNVIESQMIPVSQWGYEFLVPSLYPEIRIPLRVYAIHNNSKINVTYVGTGLSTSTSVFAVMLNRGEFLERTSSNPYLSVFISSDKVTSVVLYCASKGKSDGHKSNPFMLVVPEIRQFSTMATTFPTLQFGELLKKERPFENYAVIILKQGYSNDLRYNSHELKKVQSDTIPISDDTYTVIVTQLDNVTQHTVSAVNNSYPLTMAVFVYGMARFESYGFMAGFEFIDSVTDCIDLVDPEHGSISSTRISHGNHVTVSCDPGYTLVGDKTLVCLSGTLTGPVGSCQADCNDLVAPVHGYISSTQIIHGKHVTVSCNPGYSLVGDKTLVCLSGTLTGPVGSCEADCHALVPPSNGWLFSKDLSSSHGNHATIFCNDGYVLLGERTLICLSGTWSGSVGTCETVKGYADPVTEPTNDSTTIIVGVVLGLIIIMLLSIIVVLCLRHKRTLRKAQSTLESPQLATLDQSQMTEIRTENNQRASSTVNAVSDLSGSTNDMHPNDTQASDSQSDVNSGQYARLAPVRQEASPYATISEEPYYLKPVSSPISS